MNIFALNRREAAVKTLLTLIAVASAVAFPQVFHFLGVLSGAGALPGATYLPMHIPVLIAGFLAGPAVGVFAGLLSPLVSFLLTGALGLSVMPVAALVPFMCIELAGYGLIAGLLMNKKLPVIAKLLIVQVGGRALRAVTVLLAVYALGMSGAGANVSAIWTTIQAGLPGIALQWLLIPLIIYRVKKGAK